ncbi:hypothetical protein QQX98_000423 [Neonectria punicea]|uniref:Uncharacterized protein n=1 Tax=Neonectria punicea TaxID=979145 RepID=A0ABR1HUT5_9HYPO
MSGIEIAGLILGALPLTISGVETLNSTLEWLKERRARITEVRRKDGLIPAIMVTLLPDASLAMERIEHVLSGTDAELAEFRQSHTSNMNMVAVAGAIVAQIAMTGLSLEAISQAHWAAAAFFAVSLILGVISVYVSFVVQQEVSGLLGVTGVADWLARPLSHGELLDQGYALSHHPAFLRGDPSSESSSTPAQIIPQLENGSPDLILKREPSALAAIMLAAPSSLLGLSLNSFMFGLGIYLGSVYTGDLVPGYGKMGSLGILIYYIVAASVGTFMYAYPRLLKMSERWSTKKRAGIEAQLSELRDVLQQYPARN